MECSLVVIYERGICDYRLIGSYHIPFDYHGCYASSKRVCLGLSDVVFSITSHNKTVSWTIKL